MTIEDMSYALDALAIRKRLGREQWGPPERFGEGWKFHSRDRRMIIATPHFPQRDWIHSSISCEKDIMPTYDDLKTLHHGVFGDGYAYQCFVPAARHVNLTVNVLHLWGRFDGANALPDFDMGMGTI
jgi:hypothetical protein